ncbi:MAG: MgtC/SapB family protein [Balneolaceae bacterium]
MAPELETLLHLLMALAVGLLIGIERGWSGGKEEEGDRVAGIRTFSLIGILGGVAAEVSELIGIWMFGVIFGSVTLLIIVSYVMESREKRDIGTTTAFAMMLTFLLASWAAYGHYITAFSVTAAVVTFLSLKPVLHKWVSTIETKEVYAGIKLLIISVVLLPLLPNQGYGPWESVNPYWIWWMVVLICSISFAGYFAIKYVGNQMGTLVTSIAGGLASSTAVTLSMAQFARQSEQKRIFMAGVLLASSIMFVRIMVEVLVVNPDLIYPLWIPLVVMFSCVIGGGVWLWGRRIRESAPDIELKNPFKLVTALKFGALLATILLLTSAMKEWFGDSGIYILAMLSGFADVDAITLSLSKLALDGLQREVATMGIILAASVNTLVKGFIFSFFVGFRESLHLIVMMFLAVIAGLLTTLLIWL